MEKYMRKRGAELISSVLWACLGRQVSRLWCLYRLFGVPSHPNDSSGVSGLYSGSDGAFRHEPSPIYLPSVLADYAERRVSRLCRLYRLFGG